MGKFSVSIDPAGKGSMVLVNNLTGECTPYPAPESQTRLVK